MLDRLYGEMMRDPFVEKFEWKPGSLRSGTIALRGILLRTTITATAGKCTGLPSRGSPFVAISQDELGPSPA